MRKIIDDCKMYRPDQIDFETNLTSDEVIRIVEKFLETYGVAYELTGLIVYDPKSHITHEPVWYVDVVPVHMKEVGFLDCEEDSIAVSDRLARLVYMMNPAGRIVEEF